MHATPTVTNNPFATYPPSTITTTTYATNNYNTSKHTKRIWKANSIPRLRNLYTSGTTSRQKDFHKRGYIYTRETQLPYTGTYSRSIYHITILPMQPAQPTKYLYDINGTIIQATNKEITTYLQIFPHLKQQIHKITVPITQTIQTRLHLHKLLESFRTYKQKIQQTQDMTPEQIQQAYNDYIFS